MFTSQVSAMVPRCGSHVLVEVEQRTRRRDSRLTPTATPALPIDTGKTHLTIRFHTVALNVRHRPAQSFVWV